MSDLYLITGFLGSGKTTFLKQFAQLFMGRRMAIIVNEFGRESVDDHLLKKLDAGLTGISGGSIFCSCRLEHFEQALFQVAAQSPEVLIIETSGLADPTSVRRVLGAHPEFESFTYKGCICLADATRLYKLYEMARVSKRQLSIADAVILNKADRATPEELSKTRQILSNHVTPEQILETSFARIPEDWVPRLLEPGSNLPPDTPVIHDIALHSLTLRIAETMPPKRLLGCLSEIAEDTFRIKGIVKLEGGTYLADGVGAYVQLTERPDLEADGNRITVLYGYGLPARQQALEAAKRYPGDILEVLVK